MVRTDVAALDFVGGRNVMVSNWIEDGQRRSRRHASQAHTARWAFIATLAFSLTQLVSLTASRYLRFPEEAFQYLLPRSLVCATGVGVAMAMFAAQAAIPAKSLIIKSLSAILLALIGCFAYGGLNELIFSSLTESQPSLVDYFANSINWFWFFLSLSLLFIALNHWAELTENRLQLEKLRTLASAAQLSALRYQLNPHFLFNTLNSIAALVVEQQPERAERMINRLSDFLRAGLDANPLEQVPLSTELVQQRRYLEIEQIRFPDRLAFDLDVGAEMEQALVPSLILQPLVENAIKYGVAPSSGLVTIGIRAEKLGEALRVIVSDDGSAEKPGSSGSGIGLQNVRERLASFFGNAASVTAGPAAGGGYAVTLTLPFRRV